MRGSKKWCGLILVVVVAMIFSMNRWVKAQGNNNGNFGHDNQHEENQGHDRGDQHVGDNGQDHHNEISQCPKPTEEPKPTPTTCHHPKETPTPVPTTLPTPTPTVKPEPSPTVTPAPQVTPSPTPTNGPQPVDPTKRTDLGLSGPGCDNRFSLKMRVLQNDIGQENVNVRFQYKDQAEQNQTNNDGYASADFNYTGDADAKAEVSGFPTQYESVRAPQNCGIGGAVLSASTEIQNGQVLGYAATGTTSLRLTDLLGILGLGMLVVGVKGFYKHA